MMQIPISKNLAVAFLSLVTFDLPEKNFLFLLCVVYAVQWTETLVSIFLYNSFIIIIGVVLECVSVAHLHEHFRKQYVTYMRDGNL
jgi:hypothetical protein